MSDDIIKRLREALAAGPTVGPWTMLPACAGEQCVARINSWEAVPPNGVELAHDSIDANYIAAASPDNIAALLDRLDAAERECERLRKFAGKVLDKSRRGFLEVSCGDIEDWAKQFGLLGLVTMSAACGDDCKCPEWVGFPLECLRPTALGSAAIDAARAAEQSERRGK